MGAEETVAAMVSSVTRQEGPTALILSSLPPVLRSNTHLRPLLTCQVPVLFPCHALKLSNVNLMNTRRKFFHHQSQRESLWKPVSLDSGTSMPPRLSVLMNSDSPPQEILSWRSRE